MAPETLISAMDPKSKKEKLGKKHKPSDGKKRKREQGEDSERRKPKKHRKEKTKEAVGTTLPNGRDSAIKESPFHTQTSTLYLPLASISQKQPLEGMCAEHLSPLILTYYPPFDGVVLSYSNPRLSERPFQNDGSETLLQCIDEYAVGYGWVTAEFLLFKPGRGCELEGHINLQNEGHLGLVCWNLFNASIARQRLPKDWKWVGLEDEETTNAKDSQETVQYAEEGIGHYVDGNGDEIEGTFKFRVTEFESSHDRERGFLSINGTMLAEDDEKELLAHEEASSNHSRDTAGRRLGGSRALGATSLGRPVEPGQDDMDINAGGRKHRRAY